MPGKDRVQTPGHVGVEDLLALAKQQKATGHSSKPPMPDGPVPTRFTIEIKQHPQTGDLSIWLEFETIAGANHYWLGHEDATKLAGILTEAATQARTNLIVPGKGL